MLGELKVTFAQIFREVRELLPRKIQKFLQVEEVQCSQTEDLQVCEDFSRWSRSCVAARFFKLSCQLLRLSKDKTAITAATVVIKLLLLVVSR